ncbi:MAG: hypothetical protein FD123_277 [Bacteroidetes bacterium]|nr:MAG: hypothetical protein FD123_277 [Bacteroidota bacterium]
MMMKNEKLDSLFNAAGQLPAEVDYTQIERMVEQLPATASGKTARGRFSRQMILRSFLTAGIAGILTLSFVYWKSEKAPEQLAKQTKPAEAAAQNETKPGQPETDANVPTSVSVPPQEKAKSLPASPEKTGKKPENTTPEEKYSNTTPGPVATKQPKKNPAATADHNKVNSHEAKANDPAIIYGATRTDTDYVYTGEGTWLDPADELPAASCEKDPLLKLLAYELFADQLIDDTSNFRFKLSGKRLSVDGVKQSRELSKKYKTLYEKHSGLKMKRRNWFDYTISRGVNGCHIRKNCHGSAI